MADIFDVIADGTRREILRLLLDRSDTPSYDGTSVSHIVTELGVSQPTVSKHLKVLRDAGLVEVRRDAQRRLYRLRVEPLRELDEWLDPYRAEMVDRLDSLERHLERTARPISPKPTSPKERTE